MAQQALKKFPKITDGDFAHVKRLHIVRWANASISIRGNSFVMEGPSGTHSLLIEATDQKRLNAHWVSFASHPLNQISC